MAPVLVAASLLFLSLCLLPAHCERPNIVLVLADDLGWADLNSSSIPTPHLDQLSASGLRLSSHYAQPTCTPTRAALMTGRYAHNTGLTFAIYAGSKAGLPPDIPTMPELLRKAGYSAHMESRILKPESFQTQELSQSDSNLI